MLKDSLKKLWARLMYAGWWVCHEFLFDLEWFVGRITARYVADVKVIGAEQIPRKAGFMITANHRSQWDLLFMQNLLPRSAYFMTKREYFEVKFLGGLVRLLGAFPVNRGKYDRQALQYSIDLLKQGRILVIFPEGTRTKDGRLQEGHSGAALIAARADALIVPVAFTGTEDVHWKKRTGPDGKPVTPQVTVRVGRPYRLPRSGPDGRRISLEEQSDLLMSRIAELLPPEYRGHYSAEKLAERQADRRRNPAFRRQTGALAGHES